MRRIRHHLLTFTAGTAFILSGCADSENFLEFRETAGPTIETGVLSIFTGDGDIAGGIDSIVTGIINGVFEVVEPDTNTDTN